MPPKPKTAKPILVLHGPNLNLLGQREPKVYGKTTLAEVNTALTKLAKSLGHTVDCRQSNHEGELITWVQEARKTTAGLIINPGGYSHTSIALRDTLAAYEHPIVEVHISNIYKREGFRHHSYISAVATGMITGLGTHGYLLGLQALAEHLK